MATLMPFDVTIQSAKDLKNVNIFSKMDVYAVAFLSTDPNSRQRTATSLQGGKNPSWNDATLRFFVPAGVDLSGIILSIILRSERSFGDRDIGEVHVPVKELETGTVPSERVVTYEVRRPSGRPRGSLNFVVKFGEPVASLPPYSDPPSSYPAPYPAPATGTSYPAPYPAPATGTSYQAPYPAPATGTSYPAPYPAPAGDYKGDQPVTAYPAGPNVYPPYPPAPGYSYPPQGYGYPPAGYGYQQQKPKKSGMGMGLGAGLLGGALGGLLVGDMISDAADYADYGDVGGGFDF